MDKKNIAGHQWTMTTNKVMAYSKSLLGHLTKYFYYSFVYVWLILFTFCPFVQYYHNDNKFLDTKVRPNRVDPDQNNPRVSL